MLLQQVFTPIIDVLNQDSPLFKLNPALLISILSAITYIRLYDLEF